MASKRRYEESYKSNAEKHDEITKNVLKKTFLGSATFKVTFKCEWKALYPVTEVKQDTDKLYSLTCGKNLNCYHEV